MTRVAQRLFARTILGIAFAAVLFSLIAYARGYRFNVSQRQLDSTGILIASSFPDGAKIYLNGELFGATNENIILEPGVFDVEIKKDGFTTWRKTLSVKGELVVKADALLFPQNPSLSPVTSLGFVKVATSPSKDKVVLMSQTGDEEKDGIYVLENSRNPLTALNQVKLLVPKSSLPFSTDLSEATVEFSPDEKEIVLTIYSGNEDDENTTEETANIDTSTAEKVLLGIYLLDLDETTEQPFSITPSVTAIRDAWDAEADKTLSRKIQTYKKPLPDVITDSFDIISFSPDEEKILYKAKQTIDLPIVIKPRLIATNQTEETRTLTKGNIYVYDSSEDKNFEIFAADYYENSEYLDVENINDWLFWYIDNAHLVMVRPDENGELSLIAISDYDGSNLVDVYTGPFEDNFLSMTKNGKLLILTNLNARSGQLPDVYTVGIR